MVKKIPKQVLFVCTANVCRSPMAAALFGRQIKALPGRPIRVKVDSAGTRAFINREALNEVLMVMRARQLDISDHRSKPVSETLVMNSSLVLTMEPGQKEALRAEFPKAAGRIFLLSELSGPPLSVQDPVGGTMDDYAYTADRIDELIARGMPRILEFLNKAPDV